MLGGKEGSGIELLGRRREKKERMKVKNLHAT